MNCAVQVVFQQSTYKFGRGWKRKLQSWLPQSEGREGGRKKEDVCEYEFYSQGIK